MNLAVIAGLYHFLRNTSASEIWIERALATELSAHP
jgi:hypothetical protein